MHKKVAIAMVAVLICGCIELDSPESSKEPAEPVSEPTYEGRTLDEWIAASRDRSERQRVEAAAALASFASDEDAAVERLREMARDDESLAVRGYISDNAREHIPPVLAFDIARDRLDARANELVNIMVMRSNHPRERGEAAIQLMRLHPLTSAPVRERIDDGLRRYADDESSLPGRVEEVERFLETGKTREQLQQIPGTPEYEFQERMAEQERERQERRQRVREGRQRRADERAEQTWRNILGDELYEQR